VVEDDADHRLRDEAAASEVVFKRVQIACVQRLRLGANLTRTRPGTADKASGLNLAKKNGVLTQETGVPVTTYSSDSVNIGIETISEAGAGVPEVPQVVEQARRPVSKAWIRQE
jgi:hypothetical protein